MYNLQNPISPYNEKIYAISKDKNLIIRECAYNNKKPFKIILEKYYLIAYKEDNIINDNKYKENESLAISLNTIINENIIVERYSRLIKYEDSLEKQNFFILKVFIDADPGNKNTLDQYYSSVQKYSKNIEKWVSTLGIELIVISYKTVMKLIQHSILTLKDLNINLETPKKIFSANYKDIVIFTKSNRLSLVNRPMNQPVLLNNINLGKSLRDDNKIGVQSKKLLIIGNNYLKNYNLIREIYQQIYKDDSLLIIYNFRSFSLQLPLIPNVNIKDIKLSSIDVDPFQLLNIYTDYQNYLIPIIKNLFIHSLQLLPSYQDILIGTMLDYIQTSKKGNQLVSIGGYINYLRVKMETTATNEETEQALEQALATMAVNMNTNKVLGNISDKAIESLYNIINYLFTIISSNESIPINSFIQKKGIIVISSENSNIENKILGYSILLELLQLSKIEYKIITIGLEKFFLSIPFDRKATLINYEKYFNQDVMICELDNMYYDYLNIFNNNKLNIVYSSNVSLKTEGNYEKINNMLNIISTQKEVYALLRYDYNDFLYFTIPQNKDSTQFSGGITQFPKMFIEVELEDVVIFELIEKILNLPEFLCVPQFLAFINENDYFEGEKIVEKMIQLNYIKKTFFYKHYIITDQIKAFILNVQEYFKQFDKRKIDYVSKVSNKDIYTQYQELISFYLPIRKWDLIINYLLLLQQKMTIETATDNLREILINDNVPIEPVKLDQSQEPDNNQKNNESEEQIDLTKPPNITKNSNTSVIPGLRNIEHQDEENPQDQSLNIFETYPNDVRKDNHYLPIMTNDSDEFEDEDDSNINNNNKIEDLIVSEKTSNDENTAPKDKIDIEKLKSITVLTQEIQFIKCPNIDERLATLLELKPNEPFSSLLLLANQRSTNTLSNLLSILDEIYSKD